MYAHTIVHTTHAYPFCVASRWCTFGFGTTTTGSSTKCWKQWCKKRWIFLLSAVTNFTNRSPTRWHTNDVNLCILRKIEMCAFDMHTCYMWLDALDTNESVGEYKTYARVHLLRSLPWIAAPIPPHSLTTHPHYTHTQVKKEKGGMELIAYNPPLKHNIWRQDHPEVRPNAHTHTHSHEYGIHVLIAFNPPVQQHGCWQDDSEVRPVLRCPFCEYVWGMGVHVLHIHGNHIIYLTCIICIYVCL